MSSMTLRAFLRETDTVDAGAWRNLSTVRGKESRLRRGLDGSFRLTPFVPLTATQLFWRKVAESVHGTAVVPMRERYGSCNYKKLNVSAGFQQGPRTVLTVKVNGVVSLILITVRVADSESGRDNWANWPMI